jgi:immune inhibitor A
VYEGDPMTAADDIIVGPYTMQPENSGVGVFAEEFGHNFFGLPDLYTLDASNSIGDWNIMSGGAWMGWLGGTRPAGMPLWFRMIALCGEDAGDNPIYCNWQEPMITRAHTDAAADVTIGQLEKTPPGVDKGVRINLPDYAETTQNEAGTGKGASSGTGRDETDVMLDRQIAVGPGVSGTLTVDAYWDIEEDWDYGYVMVNGEIISDTDGVFTDFNPYGNNLGWGLTGSGGGTLRFDLSAYAGQMVTLTLRYKTDAGVTYPGWWVDNVMLDDALIDDFEGAAQPGTFPGWTNSDPGWFVVPTTRTYQRYYLVEWRTMTKYDQMIHKAAYVHNYVDETQGNVVSRIPYNMPAALLYYRDTKYGATYALVPNAGDPPSLGSKYQLLIVDQNWEPARIFSDTEYLGYWTGGISSYDSALTLQATDPFTIPAYHAIPGLPPQYYVSRPAVTKFNDALGYYGGFYYGAPCTPGYVCYTEQDGSAVIPARGPYSTRISDFNGYPIYWFYGYPWAPSWLGSGRPGYDNVQLGVNIELKSKAGDDAYNSTATLGFSNYSVDIETAHDVWEFAGPLDQEHSVTYETVVENTGTEVASNVVVTFTLDARLTAASLTSTGGTPSLTTTTWTTNTLVSGQAVTVTLVATGAVSAPASLTTWVDGHDGQTARGPWFFDTHIETGYFVYLPVAMRD